MTKCRLPSLLRPSKAILRTIKKKMMSPKLFKNWMKTGKKKQKRLTCCVRSKISKSRRRETVRKYWNR